MIEMNTHTLSTIYHRSTNISTFYTCGIMDDKQQLELHQALGQSNYGIGPHRTISGDIGPHQSFIVYSIGQQT